MDLFIAPTVQATLSVISVAMYFFCTFSVLYMGMTAVVMEYPRWNRKHLPAQAYMGFTIAGISLMKHYSEKQIFSFRGIGMSMLVLAGGEVLDMGLFSVVYLASMWVLSEYFRQQGQLMVSELQHEDLVS